MPKRSTFAADVSAWAAKSNARIAAVLQESTARTIDLAERTVAEGGRMRVDTGFLRASGKISMSGLPGGPSRPVAGNTYAKAAGADLQLLSSVRPGQTIWYGWTANYARYREYKDGFLRLAAQQWKRTVAAVTSEARSRYP